MHARSKRVTDNRLRIMMAGPMPPPLGGATVLFGSLSDALARREDVTLVTVDTARVRGAGIRAPGALTTLLREIAAGMRDADVAVLHVATSALHVMGPAFARAAAAAGRPFLIRKFGGTDFTSFDPLRRVLIGWALARASLYLAETKELVKVARAAGLTNVRWFPNSRPMPPLPEDPPGGRACKRFVFLGQVRRPKGICELIEAAERLGGDVSVDVYGPLGYDVPESAFDGLGRVRYAGVLEPGRVHAALSAYDALVLPSHHAGEGYPGVILEAYGAGLPVVATRWRSLPELVDDASGMLVEPRDADALRAAMQRLADEPGLYAALRRGVRARRREFSDDVWHERFVTFCREAATS